MNPDEIAHGYARAAFESALESWIKVLDIVDSRLKSDPNMLTVLENSALPVEERQARLKELLPETTPEGAVHFLFILLNEKGLQLLADIKSLMGLMAKQVPSLLPATVTSAIPLTDEEMGAFRKKLGAKYGPNLEIRFKVDPGILGGVIIQVGDKVLDASIIAKLDALKESLNKTA